MKLSTSYRQVRTSSSQLVPPPWLLQLVASSSNHGAYFNRQVLSFSVGLLLPWLLLVMVSGHFLASPGVSSVQSIGTHLSQLQQANRSEEQPPGTTPIAAIFRRRLQQQQQMGLAVDTALTQLESERGSRSSSSWQWLKSRVYVMPPVDQFSATNLIATPLLELQREVDFSGQSWPELFRGWPRLSLLPLDTAVVEKNVTEAVQICLEKRERLEKAVMHLQAGVQSKSNLQFEATNKNVTLNSRVQKALATAAAIEKTAMSDIRESCHADIWISDWSIEGFVDVVPKWGIQQRGVAANASEDGLVKERSNRKKRRGGAADGLLKSDVVRKSWIEHPFCWWRKDFELSPTPLHRNVSFILQYFRQPTTVDRIVDRIASYMNGSQSLPSNHSAEFIANVDEPSNFTLWMRKWRERKDVDFMSIFFQHNMHEIRGYNTAMRGIRSPLVTVLQDDNDPGGDVRWFDETIASFTAHPDLNLVGGNNAVLARAPFISEASVEYRFRGMTSLSRIMDPKTEAKSYAAANVDFAPMTMRRRRVLQMGGINQGWSKRGESGVFSDWHLSVRSWMAGHKSMHLMAKNQREYFVGLALGGTHSLGAGISSRTLTQSLDSGTFGRQIDGRYMQRVAKWVFHALNYFEYEEDILR